MASIKSALSRLFNGRTIELVESNERSIQVTEEKAVTPGQTVDIGAALVGINRTRWNRNDLIDKRLKANSWVYACVRYRAVQVSSAKFIAYTKDGKPLPDNHDLQQLLNEANAHWTFSSMIERAQQYLDVTGEAFIMKIKISGGERPEQETVALWTINPNDLTVFPDPDGYISHFMFTGADGKTQRIETHEVIHIMYPNPDNVYRGMSPMEAAINVIDTDTRTIEWNRHLIDNTTGVGLVVKHKHKMSAESWQDAMKRLVKGWRGAANAGTPMILDADADIVSTPGLTPKELDFAVTRGLNREEICAVYAVPPPLVGLYDKATLNNIKTARQIFWQETAMPLCQKWADILTMSMAREFDSTYVIKPDLSHIQPVQEVKWERIDATVKLVDMGMPFYQAADMMQLGAPRFAGDDVSRLPANKVEADTLGEGGDVGF